MYYVCQKQKLVQLIDSWTWYQVMQWSKAELLCKIHLTQKDTFKQQCQLNILNSRNHIQGLLDHFRYWVFWVYWVMLNTWLDLTNQSMNGRPWFASFQVVASPSFASRLVQVQGCNIWEGSTGPLPWDSPIQSNQAAANMQKLADTNMQKLEV